MAIEDYMLPCPTKKLFGLDCLGCGSQRAFVLLLKGDFSAAFQIFPAIYTLVLFAVFGGISLIDRKRKYGNILTFLAIINVMIMLISYIYKHYY
ncbi:DUF2752 domain-containing protein [Riemerella columbina]|nr:DUF2752 domain-containing protein [Riemerella columbina]WKS96117.1 DUF2752 domain-containing protein [Riemerella columbina]